MKCCFYHHFPQHNLTLNKATKQECLPSAASCLIQVAREQANLSETMPALSCCTGGS